MRFKKSFLVILSILFLCSSCKFAQPKSGQILDDSVYWTIGDINQTVSDAEKLTYEPLELEYKNLSDRIGIDPTYVWIKIPFTLNENLRYKPLGLVIPYLHFSEKTWLNGSYIGQYGEFEPNQYSPMFQAHFYTLPQELLNQDGENCIYIKVLSFGTGTVSKNISIDEYLKAYKRGVWQTFACSKVYMIFSGILFCSFLLFLIFYFARKEKTVLKFAMICLTSFVFLSYYNAPEMPYYGMKWVGTFLFTKIVQCCFFYFTVYTIVSFILTFVEAEIARWFIIFKRTVVCVTVIITLVMPTYQSLSRICIPMVVAYFMHFVLGMSYLVTSLFKKETRKKALTATFGFLPMVVAIYMDIIIRHILKIVNYPYFVLFGLVITIIYFIVYFSLDYGYTYKRNQTLTDDLRREVELQMVDLTFAKESLEQQVRTSERDMEMASIVQQKFFPIPETQYNGWNSSLVYVPLEKVSGDLYDFYSTDNELNGLALFDASGHGVAAALVTMLTKNIIFRSFHQAQTENLTMSTALENINQRVIKAKGNVENYLTGVLARFNNDGNVCNVELASAGHPYPVWYSAEKGNCVSFKDMETGPHYGAVGMAGIDVSYCNFKFQMKPGDILVCFSDGIIETQDENHNEFGRIRLEHLVTEYSDLNAIQLSDLIADTVKDFRGDNPRDDDITLIIMKKE